MVILDAKAEELLRCGWKRTARRGQAFQMAAQILANMSLAQASMEASLGTSS